MPARARPGSPCPDAPVAGGWLLGHLGRGFTLLTIGVPAPESLTAHGLTVPRLALDATPEIRDRYLGEARGAVYLIRPDQHVAARWDHYDARAVSDALARAIGKE
jgi:3-(3-hydroxy-phenyl)propionate hydroxylase